MSIAFLLEHQIAEHSNSRRANESNPVIHHFVSGCGSAEFLGTFNESNGSNKHKRKNRDVHDYFDPPTGFEFIESAVKFTTNHFFFRDN